MVNSNLTNTSSIKDGVRDRTESHNEPVDIYSIFNILTCSFGMLGNGIVIWLLGFQIKRNRLTTYVLNLAVADFGLLTTIMVLDMDLVLAQIIKMDSIYYYILIALYHCMLSSSQFLITAISMDRCVSVYYPLWYRFNRPVYFSTVACVLIWILTFLPCTIDVIHQKAGGMTTRNILKYLFIANGILCLPLMTFSSLMLFIKVCSKSKQQRKRKLLITILISVLFYLFLSFPFNALYMIYYVDGEGFVVFYLSALGSCLNSSVNPLIYYLIGRSKKGHSKKSMKAALQRLFKEGKDTPIEK